MNKYMNKEFSGSCLEMAELSLDISWNWSGLFPVDMMMLVRELGAGQCGCGWDGHKGVCFLGPYNHILSLDRLCLRRESWTGTWEQLVLFSCLSLHDLWLRPKTSSTYCVGWCSEGIGEMDGFQTVIKFLIGDGRGYVFFRSVIEGVTETTPHWWSWRSTAVSLPGTCTVSQCSLTWYLKQQKS